MDNSHLSCSRPKTGGSICGHPLPPVLHPVGVRPGAGAAAGDADAALCVEQDQLPGQGVGLVTDVAVHHRRHRAAHDLHPQGGTGVRVIPQGLRPLRGIPGGHLPGDGGGVHQAQVEEVRRRVLEDGLDVVGPPKRPPRTFLPIRRK